MWFTGPYGLTLYVSEDGGTVQVRKADDAALMAQRRGCVQVAVDGTVRRVSVSRLVLLALEGEPPGPDMVPVHLNGDGSDCRPANLRWGTRGEALAAHAGSRRTVLRGEANGSAKLTCEQRDEIEAAVAAGESHRAVARRYGISHTQVGRIGRGESWKAVAA